MLGLPVVLRSLFPGAVSVGADASLRVAVLCGVGTDGDSCWCSAQTQSTLPSSLCQRITGVKQLWGHLIYKHWQVLRVTKKAFNFMWAEVWLAP